MSFVAKLELGANTYNILTAEYEVSQPVGQRNMPNDEPHIGLIKVVLESNNKEELFAWAMSPQSTKNGKIVFYRKDAQSSMKTLNFTDTFCIYYREVFENTGDIPMKVYLTLSAREIECQGVSRNENWPGFRDSASSSSGSGGGSSSDSGGGISSFNPD